MNGYHGHALLEKATSFSPRQGRRFFIGSAPNSFTPCPWDGLEPAGGIEPPTY